MKLDVVAIGLNGTIRTPYFVLEWGRFLIACPRVIGDIYTPTCGSQFFGEPAFHYEFKWA